MEIQHHEPGALPRQKRIKVSKACYTCRVKKIKCDGLNPCMQCKARQRPCSFSADGLDSGALYLSRPSMQSPTLSTSGSSTSPPSLSPRQVNSSTREPTSATTATETVIKTPSTALAQERRLLDMTTQRLDTLGQAWPGCEYEDLDSSSWSYQQDRQKRQINTPPLSFFLATTSNQQQLQDSSNSLSSKVVSSASNLQQTLISLYYRHRYRILPILPKTTLLSLLNRPSPQAFISPLLLSALYAQAAQSSASSSSDADHYANSAKSILDSYLDTPQLSTVIALVLLSLYESNRHGYNCSPCQAAMYQAMAIRMCFDLNLHNCVNDGMGTANNDADNDNSDNMAMMIKALKLRVFWCCYCLDKWTSLCTNRPWMIHSNNIDSKMELNGSLLLGMEGVEMMMNHEEQTAIEGLVASIHLAQLGERLLEHSSISSIDKANQADHQLLSFLQHLPASLNWTPLPTPDSLSSPASSLYQPIPSHPPHNSIVGQFHLIFNLLHLTLLTRPLLAMTTVQEHQPNRNDTNKNNNKEQVSLLLQRCSTVATNLTQLGCALTDQTGFILCYRMVAHALMLSVRVHLIQCYNVMQPSVSSLSSSDHHRTAKHARLMFQRSLRSLRILVQHRVIPDADTFTTSMEQILETLTLVSPSPLTPYRDNISRQHNISNTNTNTNTSYPMTNTHHQQSASLPYHQQYQQQQQTGYLNGAEQSAAEVLSNAFNTSNTYDTPSNNGNNDNSKNTPTTGTNPVPSPIMLSRSSPSPPPPSTRVASQSVKQQQQQPLVDVSSLYTSIANNHLYHQQIQPHFGYSLPSGKQDEVWALQEQYQQQQQQQQQQQNEYHPSPTSSSLSSSSSSTYTPMNMYSTQLWPSSQLLPTSSTPMKKKSSSSPSPSTSTTAKPSSTPSASDTPTPTSSMSMASSPYKSIGLGVYASAQRHHSDVIGQHFAGDKTEHRPVILNRHGQVVVTSSGSPHL